MIQEFASLEDKTWFKTGGVARWFVEPCTFQEFQNAVCYARNNGIKIALIGEGANILISDKGFDGLIIRPSISYISHVMNENHVLVTAGAGATFSALIAYCLDNGLLGLEEFSGIPGTVGGSVYINIHYFRHLLSDFLVSATVIDSITGDITIVDHGWFKFGYNQSQLHQATHYLLDATFRVKKGDLYEIAYARGRSHEIIRHRQQRYPRERTCGSFFRNFYEHEVTIVSNNKKMIYVGYYLDKIGVKGELSIGRATVSYQHANMIVTSEGATSSDVVMLARAMQQLVFDKFGILPQSECQFIGFNSYPLLTINSSNFLTASSVSSCT